MLLLPLLNTILQAHLLSSLSSCMKVKCWLWERLQFPLLVKTGQKQTAAADSSCSQLIACERQKRSIAAMLCCHLPRSSVSGLTASPCESLGVKCVAEYSIVWHLFLAEPRGPWTVMPWIHTGWKWCTGLTPLIWECLEDGLYVQCIPWTSGNWDITFFYML